MLLSCWHCQQSGGAAITGLQQKAWIRTLPGRPAVQELLLLPTPEGLLQQQLQQAPVSLLLSQLKTLQEYGCGWQGLTEAPAEQLSVQGQSERSQPLGQVQLEQLTPRPAALQRSWTLADYLALLQRQPGRPEYPLAVQSAAASAALPMPAAEVQRQVPLWDAMPQQRSSAEAAAAAWRGRLPCLPARASAWVRQALIGMIWSP